MQHTENLNLNLPNDNDPLEVSKLSENFEILDEAIGDQSSAAALAKSMKIGDITYSTRNLEEESGGVLMACDQRTIDTDAYPDIPRDVLFWPASELVFTYSGDPNIAENPNANYSAYTGVNRDANTDKFIYVNGFATINSTAGSYNLIYSVDEKKIYATSTGSPFVRIAPSKIVLLNGAPQIYNNVLAQTGETQSAGAAALRSVNNGAITRLGPSSFFILSWQASSAAYPLGFYKTDDGFTTIQPITVSSTLENINATTFDQLDDALRTGALHKSPFFPIQKKADGEVVVCFKGSASGATYTASSEIGTRQNIRNMLPTVWETSGGLSTISSRKLGGQALEDWVWNKMVEHNDNAGTGIYAPLNGEYYFLRIGFASNYYAVTVNIETGEFFFRPVSGSFMNTTSGYKIGIRTVYYDRFRKQLINIRPNGMEFTVVDIGAQTVEESVYPFGGFNVMPTDPINYMDSFVAIRAGSGNNSTFPVEKRSFDRGYPIHMGNPLILIGKDIGSLSGFMAMNIFGIYGNVSRATTQTPYIYFSKDGGSCASNIVEVDGDIYVPYQRSLYKLPKNKRQMPYIKNGYMKVLNEPEEGGTE